MTYSGRFPDNLDVRLREIADDMEATEEYLKEKYGPRGFTEYQMGGDEPALLREAADEIERLKAENAKHAQVECASCGKQFARQHVICADCCRDYTRNFQGRR